MFIFVAVFDCDFFRFGEYNCCSLVSSAEQSQ